MMTLRMALRSIGANKMRAMLTMLGIIIGVVALVVLVSLVNGATSSVTDAVSSLGSDMLTVTISDDKGKPIDMETLSDWTRSEPAIGLSSSAITASLTGKYGSESDSFTVYGTNAFYDEIAGLKLCMGRFLNSADVSSHTRVCVISYKAATELIGYTDCIGEQISFNGMKFSVVGVLSDSESITISMLSSGYTAYVPYTSLMRLSDSVTEDVTTFVVRAPENRSIDETERVLREKLTERFERDEDAFSINSMNFMEEAMSSVASVLSVLLGGIAAISLIVGGIGIMNIMLVTVTERTREIGIRKAIGATRGTILRQFLTEAVVLCMLGCAIGIFLSWTILRMVAVIASSLSMSFRLNGTVVIVAVGFCVLIGVIFGLYPANKAAKMKPIDALHYGG